MNQPQPSDAELDWLVNNIISHPIAGRAIFAANAIQAGTPQSPIPISPSAHREYQLAQSRIGKAIQAHIAQNYISRAELGAALVDERPIYGGDKYLQEDPNIRNELRADLRKQFGLEG